MLISIDKSFISSKINQDFPDLNYYLDLNKHYPVFKLLDFTNLIEDTFYFESSVINNITINKKYYNLSSFVEIDKFNKANLNTFLSNYRTNNIFIANTYTSLKYLSQMITCLSNSLHRSSFGILSFYTLGNDNGFIYLCCIKPEYIYYIKLCILAKVEPEFDCFYILAIKDGKNRCLGNELITYNKITKLIKDYSIPTIFVDSIEAEISKTLNIPKFNTIRDYNNWLVDVKEGFLNSLMINNGKDNNTDALSR
jgi:hypothetical protein